MTKWILLAAILALLLVGCGSTPPNPFVEYITVPCQEKEPQRPPMPFDTACKEWRGLDAWTACAAAEIDRLTAYSGELLTALRNCTQR